MTVLEQIPAGGIAEVGALMVILAFVVVLLACVVALPFMEGSFGECFSKGMGGDVYKEKSVD